MRFIITAALLLSVASVAQASPFNHGLIQKGAINKGCYRDPCSVGKVVSFRKLQQSKDQSMIELKMLGGTQADGSRIVWNRKPHSLIITCSKTRPAIDMDGQASIIPLNPDGVPGVMENSASLYLQACHGYTQGDTAGASARYGYNIVAD